ncbi:hypothetical protein H6776_00390 [Candidatus Nomurabacteria bacterium]|nr:hypothetical protein [Candidatus Nomurabacteria bacterium]
MSKKKTNQLVPIIVAVLAVFLVAVILVMLLLNKSPQQLSLEQAEPVLELMRERFPDSPIYEHITDPTSIVLVANPNGLACNAARTFITELDYPYYLYQINEEDYLEDITNQDDESCPIDEDNLAGLNAYPTIFIKDTVFIGFNKKVKKQILEMIKS